MLIVNFVNNKQHITHDAIEIKIGRESSGGNVLLAAVANMPTLAMRNAKVLFV